ncbi:MAG: DNA internalization-related competence protein ComEC/Rec2 [Ignavibacteriaceae bacterium]|nr:DNA internalization-related competence protein ComEC/Rec2 [Ignavibacteriaceae bacterium]
MKNYPAVKFTLLIMAGILLDKIIPVTAHNYFIYFISLVSVFFIALLFSFQKKSIINKFSPVYILIILGSVFVTEFQKPNYNFLPQEIEKQKDFKARGIISNIELRREHEIVLYLDADSASFPGSVFYKKITLICRIRDENKKNLDSLYNAILPGNTASVKGLFMKGNNRRNPGEFNYNQYLCEKGISGILYVYNVKDINILNKHDAKIQSVIFNVRKSIDNEITNLHQPQTAGFIRGQLLADRSNIDYNAVVEFINSGVVHILAVSGLNVGFIVLIIMIVLGRFNVYFRSILMILCIIVFLVLTDSQASIVRAVVMSILVITGFLTNRSTNIYNSLAVSALIILLADPAQLFDPGFQLSYSAVLSIAVIYPVFQKTISNSGIKNKWIKYILLFIGISLCAQLGTLPFTLFYFGKLSLVSLFTNLIIIPLSGVIVGIGIFTLFLNLFTPLLASFYAAGNDFLNSVMFYIIKMAGSSEHSFLWIRNFSVLDGIIFYLFLAVFLYALIYFESKIAMLIVCILVFANVLVLCSLDNKNLLPDNYLHVLMVDVGQGDAFLIKFPDGKTALIDAGEATLNFDNGERIILPLLNHLGIDKIDYGFISHVDLDHYGGFISLINENKIGKIYKPYSDTSFSKDIKLEKFLRANNIPVNYYEKGIIKLPAGRIYILNDYSKNVKLTTNNGSGLLKILYGSSSFLFTGDLERRGEIHYINSYGDFLKSDVLKVSHHGSQTATSEEFVSRVKPKISLISDGIKNKFGHPSGIVLQRLSQSGSGVLRTDKYGAILLRSDGDNIFAVDWRNF